MAVLKNVHVIVTRNVLKYGQSETSMFRSLLFACCRSDSVCEAVWWKSGMLIQDQGCFAAHKYTAEGCLSAPPAITLNHSTQFKMFVHMYNLSMTHYPHFKC